MYRFTSCSRRGGFFSFTAVNSVIFKRNLQSLPSEDSKLKGPIAGTQTSDQTRFPLGGHQNFAEVRKEGYYIIDKSRYIPLLSDPQRKVKLICRPRRFGKSFTVSMLYYFHSVDFKPYYSTLFGNLDVNDAVTKNKIHNGQYFVLPFDFAAISGSATEDLAVSTFYRYINNQLKWFVSRKSIQELGLALTGVDFTNCDLALSNLHIVITEIDSALENGVKNFENVKGVCCI